jgi:ubiquinone/menaquinone biosynthesis C-methylase UbiE
MADPVGRAVPDADSNQELFVSSWDVYRKMVDNDYLSHRGAYATLRTVLLEREHAPFSFLDVACGDACMSVQALQGTSIREYVGIDISADAVSRAHSAVSALGCGYRFCIGDFRDLLSNWSTGADVVWIGLSLHHCQAPEKLRIMLAVRRILPSTGLFLIYEDTCMNGETREDWLSRWDAQEASWSAYTAEEWEYVCSHVHSSDFPESESTWQRLASDAGFSKVSKLYESSSKLFGLYCFQP